MVQGVPSMVTAILPSQGRGRLFGSAGGVTSGSGRLMLRNCLVIFPAYWLIGT